METSIFGGRQHRRYGVLLRTGLYSNFQDRPTVVSASRSRLRRKIEAQHRYSRRFLDEKTALSFDRHPDTSASLVGC